jgi:hypothetical protein
LAVTDVEVKPKISVAEMERRRAALRYAVAHNRIEGQSMSSEGSAICEAYVRGEISEAEIDRRLHALHCRL